MSTDQPFAPLPLIEDTASTPIESDPAETDLHTTPADLPADSAPAGKRRSRSGQRPLAKVSARAVRTILAKAAELSHADAADVELLAATLGVRNDVDEIIAHVISTPRVQLAGLDELAQIVEVAADPFEAMARAMQFEAAAKNIWGVLVTLGLVTGAKPAKESETSMAIARAAVSFGPEHSARVDAVRQLAGKGAA